MSVLSIGLFTYSTKPRGSVVHAASLANALTAAGHSVTLYALSKLGETFYRELSCQVRLVPAAQAPDDPEQLIQQRIAELMLGLRRLRPSHDVYHAEDCLAASALLASDGALGLTPVVRTLHHVEHFESAYLRACQRRSVVDADAVLCVSALGQRDVASQFGRSCPIISNGVDRERFERRDLEREQSLRARFAISMKEMVILSVGGVEPRKNSLRALEAFARVAAAVPHVRWLIVGGSSIWEHDGYRAAFAARLSELAPELRARVVQLGPVSEEDLTSLYQLSDVLLCPSLQEGFGLCVLEALCASTPVVVSDAEPFTEYLDDASATFVDPESVADIAGGLHALLASRGLCAARAEAGRLLARRFSWERVARAHERFYRTLLVRRAPRAGLGVEGA